MLRFDDTMWFTLLSTHDATEHIFSAQSNSLLHYMVHFVYCNHTDPFIVKLHVCEVEMKREGMHATDGFPAPEHGKKTSALFWDIDHWTCLNSDIFIGVLNTNRILLQKAAFAKY